MQKINTKIIIGFLLLLFQASYLITYYHTQISPFPPSYYDQAGYLSASYSLSWQAQKNGLQALALAPFQGIFPQSALFVPEGALLDLFAGGGRLSQLLLNFGAFFLVEIALYACISLITGEAGLGLAAIGLFLAQHSMWNLAGGIFDFRIDFFALCLYGVAICVGLRSGVFLNRRWTIVTALCMALLILNRFIISVYLVGVLSTVMIVLIFLSIRDRAQFRSRVRNTFICLVIVGAVVAPFIFASRTAIYNYYVVGHVTGAESAIRAKEAGVFSLIDSLEYYPISLVRDHLAGPFGIACVLIILTTIFMSIWLRIKSRGITRINDRIIEAVLVVASALIPLLILTLDESKSQVVAGIVCIPVVLLVALLPRWFGATGTGINSRRIWLVVGGIVLFCGVVTQLNYAAHERNIAERADAEHWAEGVTWLVKDSMDRRAESPRIFLDTVSGLLNPGVFSAFGYERTGTFKSFQTTFPESIFAFDATEAMDALPKSDYVILTTGAKAGVYPFWESMARAEPQVQEWTQEHLIFRHRFEMYGETIDIYSKPMITLYGESGDWIMAKGAFLRLNPEEIKPGQIIELHGPDSYRRFTPVLPAVSAVVTIAGHESIQMPASFHRIGDQYEIDIDPSPLRFLKDQTVDVEINFDSFFVPKEIGMNADTRQLVVLKPTNIEISSKRVNAHN